MSKNWLVFWNPKKAVTEEEIDGYIRSGKEFAWNTGQNRHKVPKPGDRFSFVRTGSEPRGIVGYGKVISGCKEDEHWNPESKSATTLYFWAKFSSRLVGRVLTFEQLKKLNLNHRTWSYPGTLLELEDAHDITRIRAAFDGLAARPNVLAGELEVLGFMEGEKKLLREHLRRERSRGLVELKKQLELKRTGQLACKACGFDFQRVYGKLGDGYIQAHHLYPIGKLDGVKQSTIKDLVLVCSNCHAMLHRGLPVAALHRLWAGPKAPAKRALAQLLKS
jgi:5-methylcytosine-specific restriction endonuclease McrA